MLNRDRRPSARDAHLLKVCRTRGLLLEDAEDMVQEAHARLLDYRQRCGSVRDEAALLRRIVINLSINRYHSELSIPLAPEAISELDRRGVLVDPAAGPERTLAAEQELDGVVKLLAVIGKRERQIFIAQRAGYSYEEIGTAFALKARTVEKHVATATELIGERMIALSTCNARSTAGKLERVRLQRSPTFSRYAVNSASMVRLEGQYRNDTIQLARTRGPLDLQTQAEARFSFALRSVGRRSSDPDL